MNHHDDEMSASEALAIAERAAAAVVGTEPQRPSSLARLDPEEPANLAADDLPEFDVEEALRIAGNAAAALGLPRAAMPEPSRQIAAAPRASVQHFGESLMGDLARVEELFAKMEASCAPVPAPPVSALDVFLERARSAPPSPAAPAAPTPEQVAAAHAALDAALNDYDRVADLPEKARVKVYRLYNTYLTAETERRCLELGITAGPNGEPLKGWIDSTYLEALATFGAQKRAGTLKMQAGYDVARWSARRVMWKALEIRDKARRAERSAA